MQTLLDVLAPEVNRRPSCDVPKMPGQPVRIGDNLGPIYTIVHVDGGMAWVRPAANGQQGIVPVERLRAA